MGKILRREAASALVQVNGTGYLSTSNLEELPVGYGLMVLGVFKFGIDHAYAQLIIMP